MGGIRGIQESYGEDQRVVACWEKRVLELGVATMRGYRLSQDDVIRREVISRLLCHTVIVKDEISKQFGINFDDYFAPELEHLKMPQEDGLVLINDREIRAAWLGRIFIRNLAMVF